MGQCCSDEGGDQPGAVWHDIDVNDMGLGELFLSDVHDVYHLSSDTLGKGAFASVVQAHAKSKDGSPEGMPRAVKILENVLGMKSAMVAREIKIMNEILHPNVVQVFETFRESSTVYIFMELCTGGELSMAIAEAGRLGEEQAANVTSQMLSAVQYLQAENISHRDIKGENLLLLQKSPVESCVLKLVDFGLARRYSHEVPMTTVVGSVLFMAPEILYKRRGYGPEIDLWACGCVLYIMLAGRPPFVGEDDCNTIRASRTASLFFDPEAWSDRSRGALELTRGLLQKEARRRLSADEALCDAWLARRAGRQDGETCGAAGLERLFFSASTAADTAGDCMSDLPSTPWTPSTLSPSEMLS